MTAPCSNRAGSAAFWRATPADVVRPTSVAAAATAGPRGASPNTPSSTPPYVQPTAAVVSVARNAATLAQNAGRDSRNAFSDMPSVTQTASIASVPHNVANTSRCCGTGSPNKRVISQSANSTALPGEDDDKRQQLAERLAEPQQRRRALKHRWLARTSIKFVLAIITGFARFTSTMQADSSPVARVDCPNASSQYIAWSCARFRPRTANSHLPNSQFLAASATGVAQRTPNWLRCQTSQTATGATHAAPWAASLRRRQRSVPP